MNINFVSRSDALAMIENNSVYDYELISINDTIHEAKEVEEAWTFNKNNSASAKFYMFKDIDSENSGFTYRTAESIIQFADECQKYNRDILVHCFAGVSRSGAVAKFINEYLGLGDTYLESYVGHNRYVYEKLMETAGIETINAYYKKLEKTDGHSD